ncbi:MAG: Immunoglobulin I-set domain protein [Verrucomicrobia bacterium ADurb.Bin006]|nr:MAG: Immunoglobulin I-set domain protein [Verrucomicrobia bacterium ADurb.Bin006]
MKPSKSTRCVCALRSICAILALTAAAFALQAQTVNWVGGNLYKLWSDPLNWSPQVVPLNGGGANYTVIVPANSSISFLPDLTGTIDALSFGDNSVLDIAEDSQLEVAGVGVIRGTVQTDGARSAFRAPDGGVVLDFHPRLLARNGSLIVAGSSMYQWSGSDADAGLLLADTDATIDLRSVRTLSVAGGSNVRMYTVRATENGVIDLSGLGTVTGPSGDDWLQFNLTTGGRIYLDSLQQISGRVRFNVHVPTFELPRLGHAAATEFLLSDNVVVSLPQLLRLQSGRIALAAGARLDADALLGVHDATITVADGASFEAPQLQTLERVPLALEGTGAFVAPNLSAYRESDLPIVPGRDFRAGILTDIYGARLSVADGAVFQVAATEYDTPANWTWYGTLFGADGAGSLLDLSSLRTMRTRYCHWSGYDYRYKVMANNNGVVDLSGLESITGPEYSDRLLEFNVRNNGDIRLSSLRQVSQYVRFNIEVPRYEMPALEAADHTAFVLGDGTVLEVPGLTSLSEGCSIGWGFNSEIKAPQLRNFVNSGLSLSPGRILTVPAFTNVYGARFEVSGGRTFGVAATEYDTPANWTWYGTMFGADGAGSLLDLSSLRTMRTRYCHWSGYDYRYKVMANNNGVVDLSGLESITGPEYSDRLLELTVGTKGSLLLGPVDVLQYTSLRAMDSGSRLNFAALHLHAPVRLSVGTRATCAVQGDFLFENTDANSIVIEGAYLQMDGTQPQRLEVGGKDLGPTGATTRNFGYSQLIVGETNRASVVRLVDTIDNGNRGAGGDPECLYLYGMDSAGLRLLNGSRLILNGLKVYALVNGQMQSLANLIPAGTNSAPFGEGFIALTGGPKITNMVPAIALLPPVGSVEVSFDIPIDETSFSAGDVTMLGPGGAVPITSVTKIEGNTYRLAFVPQAASGVYTVRVGPGVDELAGNLTGMDQDGDGLSGEAEQDVFVGTFTIDGDAPQIVGAFSVQNGTKIGVEFDEIVDVTAATSVGTYRVNGAAPQQAELKDDERSVVLTVPALLGDSFELTVTDLGDALGNRATLDTIGTILGLEHRDLGTPGTDPRERGSVVTFDGNRFENVAGGSAIWNKQDAGQWLFERRVGDFDVCVQLESLKKTGSWTQAGLIARESADAKSRHVYVHVQYGTGNNRYAAGCRASTGGDTAYWPETPTSVHVPVPNAWMRLKREGDVFIAMHGTNGTDWIEYARLTQSLPGTLLVGLATSAVNNNAGQATTAIYRHFDDLTPGFLSVPQNQALVSGATAVFGVVARGEAPLSYQWFHDGVPIDGATNPTLELTNVQIADVGDYRVRVSNALGENLSTVATLSVDGVGVGGGLEADVSPSPLGDGAVTIQDWVVSGRLVAALDEPVNSSQFQRADCAPAPCGDGRLSVADWTQTGLYAAALVEPIPTGCGPTEPSGLIRPVGLAQQGPDGPSRHFWLKAIPSLGGLSVEVRVMVSAQGDENAAGLSVVFDATALRFAGAAPGLAAADAVLQVNPRQAAEGRVGLALAQSAGAAFAAGDIELARLQFVALGTQEETAIDFGDRPIGREVVNIQAEVLEAGYQGTTIQVLARPKLESLAMVKDGGLEFEFSAEAGLEWIIEVSSDLKAWTELARRVAIGGTLRFADDAPAEEGRRFYRLRRVE